jgi:hypothetical protein
MRTPRITSIVVVAVLVIAAATVVRADEPQVSVSPDHVLKGTAPTITITLDPKTPTPTEITSVRVGGLEPPVTVKPPGADGKLSVPLPKLDVVGMADIEVIGKDGKTVAVGRLTYVEPGDLLSVPTREFWLLVAYVALIFLLPSICTIYDIRKSYQERDKVLGHLRASGQLQASLSAGDIEGLLESIHRGPTGFVGLTRGLLAVMLILVLAFAVFHLVVFVPTKIPDVAEKLLMLLAGGLTTIIGFYFGSKTTPQPPTSGASSSAPKITNVVPSSGPANTKLTVTGNGFGVQQWKGSVKFGGVGGTVTTWNDGQIEVAVPAVVSAGQANIVVTNDNGSSSAPWPFQVTT